MTSILLAAEFADSFMATTYVLLDADDSSSWYCQPPDIMSELNWQSDKGIESWLFLIVGRIRVIGGEYHVIKLSNASGCYRADRSQCQSRRMVFRGRFCSHTFGWYISESPSGFPNLDVRGIVNCKD